MKEPDWIEFQVDTLFDPPGVQQEKLFGFMHTFIAWRRDIKEDVSSEPVHNPVPSPTPTRKRKTRGKRSKP